MKNHFWLYSIIRMLLILPFYLLFQPRVQGKRNLPKNGKYILIGNHTGLWDWLLIAAAVRRPLRFLAMKKLFRPPFGLFFKAVGCIPVNRNGRDTAAVREAIRTIRRRGAVCIFPEGKINKTPQTLQPFHTGYAAMAMHSGAPVIPFCISGRPIPLFGGFSVTFLPPVTVTKGETDAQNREIMSAVQRAINNNPTRRRKIIGVHL